MITAKQAAKKLGAKYPAVLRGIQDGRIEAELVSGRYIVDTSNVAAYLRARDNPDPMSVGRAARLLGINSRGLVIHIKNGLIKAEKTVIENGHVTYSVSKGDIAKYLPEEGDFVMTAQDAADALDVTINTVYAMIRRGELATLPEIGERVRRVPYRIASSAVERLLFYESIETDDET